MDTSFLFMLLSKAKKSNSLGRFVLDDGGGVKKAMLVRCCTQFNALCKVSSTHCQKAPRVDKRERNGCDVIGKFRLAMLVGKLYWLFCCYGPVSRLPVT